MPLTEIKRALISSFNKEGLSDLAKQLHTLGVEIIATGGTAHLLRGAAVPVVTVEEVTGFPEIMGGRVKTLHPKIHGGLLGRRGVDDAAMEKHRILPIDLLIVSLYPFQKALTDPSCIHSTVIEQIDVGGPTMLRAAAKNYDDVVVLVDPIDYLIVLDAIKKQSVPSLEIRRRLAQKVFAYTAEYDAAIAHYLASNEPHDEHKTLVLKKKTDLRYGENPHQKAALYVNHTIPHSLAEAEQKQGQPLSFNNLMDSSAALNCVRALDPSQPACVIVKHMTPCGVAQAQSLKEAYLKALIADPVSAFGGIVAINYALDVATAQAMVDRQFIEVLLVPELKDKNVLTILAAKKKLRVLVTRCTMQTYSAAFSLHSISGGLLLQDTDEQPDDTKGFKVVTKRSPTPEEWRDCLFAWKIVRYVKSNAIVYAKDLQTLGIGAGQTSRVLSATIAAWKAKESELSLEGAVAASDAFYPFSDGVSKAAEQGVTAIIQPGGSKRDKEVIDRCDQLNLAMVMTGIRHFRH